jgi:hypothetical protein
MRPAYGKSSSEIVASGKVKNPSNPVSTTHSIDKGCYIFAS